MKISELGGEIPLINLIKADYGTAGEGDLELGIGDDAALVRCGGKLMVITADLLVEGTHFRMDINEAYRLGYKSIAVNISDVAAMGGLPTYSFVSIGLPDIEVNTVEAIYQGMHDVCAKYGSVIAGGDTVGSPNGIVINITQLGWVEPEYAAKRSSARPGDAVIVTNTLGDSRAGLELLLKCGMKEARRISDFVVERHIMPEPRVKEARAAVMTGKVHAMMDLSDGLAADISKLCAASGVGARIFATTVPISDELRDAAGVLGKSAIELAVGGGEDYELLLTCAQDDAAAVTSAVEAAGSSASVIGNISSGNGITLVSADGSEGPVGGTWEHF